MLSPKLRRQVFELWTLFWTSGMSNPLVSIEQITYLLFLQQLEKLDDKRRQKGLSSIYGPRKNCTLSHHPDDGKGETYTLPDGADPKEYCPGHNTCRWRYLLQNPNHDHISQNIFPWLRIIDRILVDTSNSPKGFDAIGGQMDDAYFQFPKDKEESLKVAIRRVDELFWGGNVRSANADLMGDTFEYLLEEIKASGKNGQFRTPRHFIRLMIALLDPDVRQPVVDPAAGTLGFPINTIQYLLQKYTSKENLLLEWDGTPHRAFGDLLTPDDYERAICREYFVGYDNDRTMVRIGWMNMILHGIENPRVDRRDTLSRSFSDDETGAYSYVEANPPFTGNTDDKDLHETRFPPNPRDTKAPITTKSELLFVWLLLDLLKVGGRGAVIVPEGVLFGSTIAHRELRRQLLFENMLEGVISLPAGAFLPYTGVKTSILIFQKHASRRDDQTPRTEAVWFYEITADGYTLDAKRTELPEPNDIWDLRAKWRERIVDSQDYYQPKYYDVRWRIVDDECLAVFPELTTQKATYPLGINERHPELPADPAKATQRIVDTQQPIIAALFDRYVRAGLPEAREAYARARRADQREQAASNKLTARFNKVRSLFNVLAKDLLETADYSDRFGEKALAPLMEKERATAIATINELVERIGEVDQVTVSEGIDDATGAGSAVGNIDAEALQRQVRSIVKEFAKLDGYNVKLRTQEVYKQPAALSESKSWAAPVRTFAVDDAWELPVDDAVVLSGSHDDAGNVRPEYLVYLRTERQIFASDGTVKPEYLSLLAPDCIEANDLNLSAGRYKPFTLAAVRHDPPVQIIGELQEMETQIQTGLNELLMMLEDG